MINLLLMVFVVGTSAIKELGTTGIEISFSLDSLRRMDYSFSEAVWLNNEGEPNLPSVVYKIGIPQDGAVDIIITDYREERVSNAVVEPVYYHGIRELPTPEPMKVYSTVYTENAFFPEDLVEVSEPGYFRDIYTVDVRLNPVRYNPVTRELTVTKDVKVRVIFKGRPKARRVGDTPFEKIYRQTIINYGQCKTWIREPKPDRGMRQSGMWFKIEVDEEGIYRIGYDDIQRAGLDPQQFDPQTIKIYTAAFDLLPEDVTTPFEDSLVEVAVYVHGEDDQSFDASDYVLFYGYAASHFAPDSGIAWFENGYARNNVYWFTFGGSSGKRMEKVNALWDGNTPDTMVTEIVHIERDIANPTRSGTNWYWLDVSPGEGSTGSGSVTLYHPRANGNAEISMGIFTLSALPFLYELSLDNEVFFSESLLLPLQDRYPPHDLSGETMVSGDSSLLNIVMTRPAGVSGKHTVFLNDVDMAYERITDLSQSFHALFGGAQDYALKCTYVNSPPFVFDITDLEAPKIFYNLTIEDNEMFLSASADSFQVLYFSKLSLAKPATLMPVDLGTLRAQLSGCDYLIITHHDFYNAIQPLADYRRMEYTTKVVNLDDVFNDFSFGKYDPLAIKHFLYYTTNNWTTYPTYVFLVGDGTYDYKNNLGKENPPNFVPMYESGTILTGDAVFIRNNVYEGEYVNFGAGEAMVLGRITVRTKQEVRDFIDKLITYETGTIGGTWNKRLILTCDDEYGTSWEGPFAHCGGCEDLIAYVPDSFYDLAKLYMVSYPPFTYPTQKPNAKEAFIRELNRGGLAGLFIGHGNTHQLAHEGLFYDYEIPRVKNGRRYFFFYFGSCTVGRFDDSDYECICEQLVRIKEGSIGTMGATKGTNPQGNKSIANKLFELITAPDTSLTFGECVRISKAFGAREYLLIGDPATKPRRPDESMALSVMPDSLRPLETLKIIPDQNRYHVKAFVRDTTHIEKIDASTIDKISGHIYREVQTSPSSYVAFDYEIEGKEIYRGYWDTDTATLIAPKISTYHLPVIKVSTIMGGRSGEFDSVRVFGTALPTSDVVGPDVMLYDGARKLQDGDWVNSEFTLTGKVSDESGMNLLNSVNDDRGFYLYINQDLDNKVDLRDYFLYDRNSHTSGEFNVQLVLPEPTDTITINVADNHYNRTITTIILQTELYGMIDVENFLVYPNPLQDESGIWFTFDLSTGGLVDFKIFTIAGRLIKTIERVRGRAGYNQIFWDGRDEYGDDISNGVYLVKIVARVENAKSELVEKFIIAR